MATVTGTKAFPTTNETIDEDYKITRERGYTLTVALEEGETIDTALAVSPPLGSGMLGFPQLWLSKRVPRQISRRLVEVDLEFAQKSTEDLDTDPVTWPAEWLGSDNETKQRVTYLDKLGKPIVMTNGEMYSTPVYEMVNILVTRYRRYYYLALPNTVPPGTKTLDDYLLHWNNSVNGATYRNQRPSTWLLSVSSAPVTVGEYELAELNFSLRFNPMGWFERRLQHGSYYLDSSGNLSEPFRDGKGNPILGFLDEDGRPNLDPYNNPTYKDILAGYEIRDFSELGF